MEKYCRTEQATDDNMERAHCMLDIEGYKYTIGTYNTDCFSNATVVERTPPSVMLNVHCLSYSKLELMRLVFKDCFYTTKNINHLH